MYLSLNHKYVFAELHADPDGGFILDGVAVFTHDAPLLQSNMLRIPLIVPDHNLIVSVGP